MLTKSPRQVQSASSSVNRGGYVYNPIASKLKPQQNAQHSQKPTHSNNNSNFKPSHSPFKNQAISNSQSSGSKPQELIIMTIDLGDGNSDSLRIFEGEDPVVLAEDFCKRHNLNPQLIEPLAQNIYYNMEQALQESVQSLNYRGSFNEYEANGSSRVNQPENLESNESRDYPNNYIRDSYTHESPQELNSKDMMFSREPSAIKTEEDIVPAVQASSRTAGRVQEMSANNSQRTTGRLQGEKSSFSPEKNKKAKSPDSRNAIAAKTNKTQRAQRDESEESVKKPWMESGDFATEDEYLDHLIRSHYKTNSEQQEQSKGEYQLSFSPQITTPKIALNDQSEYNESQFMASERPLTQNKKKNSPVLDNSVSNRISNANKSMNQSSPDGGFDINYGTLLYYRGLKKHEEASRDLDSMRKEKTEAMDKECTFKPRLNPISRSIVNAKKRFESLPDALINTGRETKEKLERAREEKEDRELEECTFTPQINHISYRIDREKSRMSEIYEQDRNVRLFEQSKARQEVAEARSQMLHPEYTFKPTINYYKSDLTFEQRDQLFKQRLERVNYLRQVKEEEEYLDPETGEMLFQPKIGRAPKNIRNHGNLPIGDYLYNQQAKHNANKKKIATTLDNDLKANRAKSSETSQLIVENLQRRRLEDIFQKLDSDEDGVISSTKIDISTVGTKVLEILAPLLVDMEANQLTLDFEGFYQQANHLLKNVSIAEKDDLLFAKNKNKSEPVHTFKPHISKMSEKLDKKKRPNRGNGDSMYQAVLEDRKKKEEKIKQLKEEKDQKELEECSFRPKLYTPMNVNKSTYSGFIDDDLLMNHFIL